jgi:lipopolysaccharide transport system ATP-binding protein
MSDIVISVENLSKQYRLGSIGSRTLRADLSRWWAKQGGQPDPLLKIGGRDPGHRQGEILWALRDVNFEVKQGEVVGIIGRNGAGKSTLLKILSRVTVPTAGNVKIKGRIASLLEVGTGFHPELTGRENIYLNGAILGMKKAEINQKFDEIVYFSGIEDFIDTPVKRYSSGMYVRLAFAVAAHLDPEILIIDEVLAVGDVEFQKKCTGKIGNVAKEGRTVLFVSHNLAAVANLCSVSILLEKGTISCHASTQFTVDKYLNQNNSYASEVYFTGDDKANNQFNFCCVRIRNFSQELKSQVSLQEGFHIEIEYDITTSLGNVNIGFILWNSRGECVFTSTDVDTNPSDISTLRHPGRYMAQCYVPSKFLRPGVYHVDIGSSIPNIKILDFRSQVIAFEVVDDSSVDSLINQGRQGIIAPHLPWETHKLS